MRTSVFVFLIVIAAIAGWFFGSKFGIGKHADDSREISRSESFSPKLAPTIRAQGKLRPAAGVINIFAPVGERIEELTNKKVGDVISTGEILATLRSRNLRQKDLELAQARRTDALQNRDYEKQQAQYKLKSARLAVQDAAASNQKIAGQAKAIELLNQQRDVDQQMLQRMEKLRSSPATKNLVNQSDIEKQELLVKQLALKIEQAQLDVELAKASATRATEVAQNNLQMIEFSITNADQATPEKSLNAAVELARQASDMTQIRSPIDDATLLEIIVHNGDTATNRPIMVLGDVSQMDCVAEVVDEFLHRIDLTKSKILRAKITSTALPEPLLGTVIEKGLLIGPVSLQDPSPFAKVDQRTGTVTIRLDKSENAAKFVNLQVEVEIEVEPGSLGK